MAKDIHTLSPLAWHSGRSSLHTMHPCAGLNPSRRRCCTSCSICNACRLLCNASSSIFAASLSGTASTFLCMTGLSNSWNFNLMDTVSAAFSVHTPGKRSAKAFRPWLTLTAGASSRSTLPGSLPQLFESGQRTSSWARADTLKTLIVAFASNASHASHYCQLHFDRYQPPP